MPVSSRQVSAHLQYQPDAKIAIVLTCPGRHEIHAGRPAVGPTGRNLDLLCNLLTEKIGSQFRRENIIITNAWTGALSRYKDGHSEPNNEIILQDMNLGRLYHELRRVNIIIASGQKAQLAVKHAFSKKRESKCVLSIPHLGNLGLKRVVGDNNQERLGKIADFIHKNEADRKSAVFKELLPPTTRVPQILPPPQHTRLNGLEISAADQELLSIIGVDAATILRFFLLFSRCEHAMKLSGYAKMRGHLILQWDRLAGDISNYDRQLCEDPKYRDAKEFLLHGLPMRQVLNDVGLQWAPEEVAAGDYPQLSLALRTVRNNLFHGGKYFTPESMRARNQQLIQHSIVILEAWAKCQPIREGFA